MPIDAQKKQNLLDAVTNIRSAELSLKQASQTTADPGTLTKISIEFNHLDSFLSQILHIQAIADDKDFASATIALKQQAATLQADENNIKKIVNDVKVSAQIVGYIAQAIALIAKA